MSASLFISDNSKHLGGEIQIKKTSEGVTIRESNISRIISGRESKSPQFDSLENAIRAIKDVLGEMCFTSRFLGKDMFTKKTYSEDSDVIVSKYIYGIQSLYEFPCGLVMYHEDNEHLFICSVIELMLQDNLIPLIYTNISDEKIYKVKRSNGDIQDCILINNTSITSDSNGEMFILNSFQEYEDYLEKKDILPGIYCALRKLVRLNTFLETNNMKLSLNLPYFTTEEIESSEPLKKQLLEYYNQKLTEFEKNIRNKSFVD